MKGNSDAVNNEADSSSASDARNRATLAWSCAISGNVLMVTLHGV
jgi:hypothetical protein